MNHKRRELPPPERVPLLETVQKEKIEFFFCQERRKRQIYSVYLFTAFLAVALCLTVLFFGTDAFETISSLLSASQAPTTDADNAFQESEGYGTTGGLLLPGIQNAYPDADTDDSSDNGTTNPTPPLTWQTLYQFNYTAVPDGEIPIIPMDLSLTSYGASYIYNATGLKPNTEAMLQRNFGKNDTSFEYLSTHQAPLVLILHTHGTEGYSKDGAISYREDSGELARSSNPTETVVEVGRVLNESLNKAGIPSVHCTVMHDKEQYKDSYTKAEDTIKQYLAYYPSIRLVIDLHRDSIVKSTGELVRPVTLYDGKAAAQVMCVVGSDWGGEENPNWEGNLALALQLREAMNSQCANLCRPVYLRSATYNQEFAPYSLLLEVGAGGNSMEEALRSVDLIAEALGKFVPLL